MRRRAKIAIVALALCAGCSAPERPYQPPEKFFPAELLGSTASLEEEWYGNQLRAMHEPALWPVERNVARYRITILPTFEPAKSMTVEKVGNQPPTITATWLNGAGGYDPGTISSQFRVALSEAQLQKLRVAFARAKEKHSLVGPGCDTTTYIFEASDASGYTILETAEPRGSLNDLLKEFEAEAPKTPMESISAFLDRVAARYF